MFGGLVFLLNNSGIDSDFLNVLLLAIVLVAGLLVYS